MGKIFDVDETIGRYLVENLIEDIPISVFILMIIGALSSVQASNCFIIFAIQGNFLSLAKKRAYRLLILSLSLISNHDQKKKKKECSCLTNVFVRFVFAFLLKYTHIHIHIHLREYHTHSNLHIIKIVYWIVVSSSALTNIIGMEICWGAASFELEMELSVQQPTC